MGIRFAGVILAVISVTFFASGANAKAPNCDIVATRENVFNVRAQGLTTANSVEAAVLQLNGLMASGQCAQSASDAAVCDLTPDNSAFNGESIGITRDGVRITQSLSVDQVESAISALKSARVCKSFVVSDQPCTIVRGTGSGLDVQSGDRKLFRIAFDLLYPAVAKSGVSVYQMLVRMKSCSAPASPDLTCSLEAFADKGKAPRARFELSRAGKYVHSLDETTQENALDIARQWKDAGMCKAAANPCLVLEVSSAGRFALATALEHSVFFAPSVSETLRARSNLVSAGFCSTDSKELAKCSVRGSDTVSYDVRHLLKVGEYSTSRGEPSLYLRTPGEAAGLVASLQQAGACQPEAPKQPSTPANAPVERQPKTPTDSSHKAK